MPTDTERTLLVATLTSGSIAQALHAEGAEIALLDLAGGCLEEETKRLGGIGLVCDVTKPEEVDAALAKVAAHFGASISSSRMPGRPDALYEVPIGDVIIIPAQRSP